MGGAVVIPLIVEILTDFLARSVSDSRHDTDKAEPNAPRLIYLARWDTKQTNKQTKTDGSFPFYSPLTRTRNKLIL